MQSSAGYYYDLEKSRQLGHWQLCDSWRLCQWATWDDREVEARLGVAKTRRSPNGGTMDGRARLCDLGDVRSALSCGSDHLP